MRKICLLIVFITLSILNQNVGGASQSQNIKFVLLSQNQSDYTLESTLSVPLPEEYNITLLDYEMGKTINSFSLSSTFQQAVVSNGTYAVFVENKKGTEEILLDNNDTGYKAGDTVVIPLYCQPTLVTCQLEDYFYLDFPWRVEPTENIPVFGIIETTTKLWNVRIYDTKHTEDTFDDTLLDQKVFSPSLSVTSSDLPYTFDFSVNPLSITKVNGNASIRVAFRVDDIIDYDNDEGPLDIHISESHLPKISNWYAGDTHFHSEYTNNAAEFGAPIETINKTSKAIGLDWVTITDHSFDLDSSKWSSLGNDCSSISDNGFRCIRGEEISAYLPGTANIICSDGYQYSHYLAYGINNYVPGGECEDGTGSNYTPSQVVSMVKQQGRFGYIAHPMLDDPFRNPWRDQDYSLDFAGLEIWNGEENIDDVESGIVKWKALLKEGRKTYIEGGSDAHGDFNNAYGKVRTYIYSEIFTEDGILDALENGHTMMTNGPIVVFDITNETGKKAIIGENITGWQFQLNMQWKSTPEFGNITNITVYAVAIDGLSESSFYLNPASLPPTQGDGLEGTMAFGGLTDILMQSKTSYVRLEATTDTDKRAYSNPIWVTKENPKDDFGYTLLDSDEPGGSVYNWIEINTTGTKILSYNDDCFLDELPVGFFFNFYGTDYSSLSITNNGIILASGGSGQYVNDPIGSSTLHNFIAPFWDDIVTWNSTSPQNSCSPPALLSPREKDKIASIALTAADTPPGAIYYQTLGTEPNRMFVVEWFDNQHFYTSPSGVTFEAVLYEGSNNITFQYKDVDFGIVSYDNGSSATIGIEGPDSKGFPYSYNQQALTKKVYSFPFESLNSEGFAILYKFPQYAGTNLYLSKLAPPSKDRGSLMTYNLFYHNFGDTAAQNVRLIDMLPLEVDYVSASDGGVYDMATRNVTWNLGSMAPQEHGYRNVTVRINESSTIGTVIQNHAKINTSNLEVRIDDNEAIAQTTVTGSNLPPDVSVEPNNGGTGTPSVGWRTPITFSYYSSCANAVGINIHFNDGGPDITGSMSETSAESWTYTTSFSRTGSTTINYIVSGCPTSSVSFNIYIDPAGYIYDINTGSRIAGATVWLQRPDGSGGWENVPIGQNPPISQPDINPLITGSDGQYQWDVLEGSYRVHVEAPGYYPTDSIVVSIPPPVTDLHVGLSTILPPIRFINGTVMDSVNKTGISGVTVSTNTTLTTTTNAMGFFSFAVTEGEYNLTAKFEPTYYKNNTITVSTIGSDVVQDIELLKKPMGTITGSVTGTPEVITVVSPNGGEVWKQSTSQIISWTSTGNLGNVNIELLKSGVYSTIISNTANDGSHSWTIPSSQTLGNDYKIRITSAINSLIMDASDDNFIISAAPISITVTSPNSGENWRHGTTHTITWSTAGSPGSHVKIELLRSETSVKTISSSTDNDGSYSWAISSTQTVAGDYKIRITSTSNSAYKDTSDNNFIIST